MSPLAKVFVVLNLILAILFLGTVSTLFTGREKAVEVIRTLKKDANETAEKYNVKLAELEGSNRVNRENVATLNNQVNSLTEDLTEAKNSNTELKGQIASKDSEISSLNTRVAQKDKHLQDKDSEISRLSTSNEELIAANQKAREDKTKAEMAMGRARIDNQQLAADLAETEVRLTKVSADLTEVNDTLAAAVAIGFDMELLTKAPAPAIDAAVMAVRPDANLVVLSVGSNDKVKIGHEFTIYRGDTFVGKVKVTKVTPDLSGARILFTDSAVEQGDRASTRVGSI